MNRMDRLLGIMLEIQASGGRRAEELANTFETSKRTIYRDLQALSEMGVPLVSVEGRGYTLTEGYFLPPLAFTVDEAALLLLGVDAIVNSFDEEYRTSADWARHKIESILPPAIRQNVDSLKNSLFFISHTALSPKDTETLRLMRRAILKQQTVRFRYFTRYPDDGRVSLREADPYTLGFFSGTWYMSGYCHLRKDQRLFRLSRMEEVTLTLRTFERPEIDIVKDEAVRNDRRTLIVRVLFDEDALPWVLEEYFYYIDTREETEEGLLVTLRVHHLDEIVSWVLGWGRRVRVLEPLELRQKVQAEARALLQNHADTV